MTQRYSSINPYELFKNKNRKFCYLHNPSNLTAFQKSQLNLNNNMTGQTSNHFQETKLKSIISHYNPSQNIRGISNSSNQFSEQYNAKSGYSVKKSISFLPPKSELNSNNAKSKKTLLLDLDETLVHSFFHPIKDPDFILNVFHNSFTLIGIRPERKNKYFCCRASRSLTIPRKNVSNF